MEHDIFISYAHKDKSIADSICEKLESAGLKCWIAARNISADQDWRDATRSAIGSSRAVVLVLSENANAAPHLKREIAHAFYTHRTVVPLRLGDTLPRRDFLFYLGKVPWLDSARPPSEQDLEALTARIKSLLTGRTVSGDPLPSQNAGQSAAKLSNPNSWIGGLQVSHHRTLGILKWAAMVTALFSAVWFLWFTLWQTKERTSLAESQLRSVDHLANVVPQTSPQSGAAGASDPRSTGDTFTRSGLWHEPDTGPQPLVRRGPQDTPLITPAEGSTGRTPPPPATPLEERAELTSASEPQGHSVTPPAAHRVPHNHHPQNQGARSEEADKTTVRATSQRDALQNQLKATETEVQTAQKNADLVAIQLESLRSELKESVAKAQTAQKKVDVLTRERDGLRKQLAETEAQAQAIQNERDLARSQGDALQAQLKEAEAKAQLLQENADLATRQREALETQLGETKDRAEQAETQASLAAGQRNAAEAELKKAQEEAALAHETADLAVSQRGELEIQLKKAQEEMALLTQHGAEVTGSNDSKANIQSREEREDAQPPREEADFANNRPGTGPMQPPNPGHNAKLPPLTQALNSSVQSTGP